MTDKFGRLCLAPAAALGITAIAAGPLMAQSPAAVPAPSGVEVTASPSEGPDAAEPEDDDVIVVTASRQRGTVIGDIAPEVTLGPQDIRAYGVSNIAELLQELSPQTASGRGRGDGAPVTLVNGKRIAGFAEIRSLPPEAIERVEIFPEELALKYGYRADQRVVNFVLRERFRAVTGELEAGGPTAGGRTSLEADANFLRIRGGKRLSLESEYKQDSLLLESRRGVISAAPGQPFDLVGNVTAAVAGAEIDPTLSALAGGAVTVAGVPASAATASPVLGGFAANAANVTDVSGFRSLLPQTRSLALAGSYATSIGSLGATISAGFDRSDSEARLGLASASLVLPVSNPFSPFAGDVVVNRYAPGALLRTSDSVSGRLGLALSGTLAGWQWTLTANYSHAETDTLTDRGRDVAAAQARLDAGDPGFNPFGVEALAGPLLQDRAASNVDAGDAEMVTSGTLLSLPAGEVSTTVKAGLSRRSLASEARRSGIVQAVDLGRTDANFQASFDLPVASVRNDVLAGIGDLSFNLNVGADRLSEFGTLTTLGYGLNWSPVTKLDLIVSVTHEEGAPTIEQLGNPTLLTPNVRVFDFVRGETVDIARLDGGNRALVADSRRVVKLGATLKPLAKGDLTLTANFIDSRITNPIASFPTATAELEAAFPDRFQRDGDGRLLQIDNRPVNFARNERRQLRWGLTFSESLEPSKAEREAAAARRAAFEAERARRLAAGEPAVVAPGEGRERRREGAGGGFGGGAGGGGRGGGGRGGRGLDGRLQLSLFHTWHLRETILIRDGVPELDLLNGSATGSGGGQPRHEIEARAGIGRRGLGARLSINWQSATRVLNDPTGATTSPDDLFFGSLGTLNLRLFADLGQRRSLVQKMPFFRGSRVSLAIDNLTDARLDVRDRSGLVPIGYQRDLVDPLGRTLTLSFRKLFF